MSETLMQPPNLLRYSLLHLGHLYTMIVADTICALKDSAVYKSFLTAPTNTEHRAPRKKQVTPREC